MKKTYNILGIDPGGCMSGNSAYIYAKVSEDKIRSGEIINPYLFRYTDYYLFKTFGLRPMPPASDRIGMLTARAIALLHHFNYHFPYITIKGKKLPIYEVYPKQIAQGLNFLNYKKDPHSVLKFFDHKEALDEHLLDALLCYAGAQILKGETTQIIKEAEGEGWCFPV